MAHVNKRVITNPPDIDGITQMLGIGRLELVSLAAGVARKRGIKPTEALWMLQRGEVTREQAKEEVIEQFRQKLPEPEVKEDDTSAQPEQTV